MAATGSQHFLAGNGDAADFARLVAADRRTRRRPMGASARRTVGQLEDDATMPGTGQADPTSPLDHDNSASGQDKSTP